MSKERQAELEAMFPKGTPVKLVGIAYPWWPEDAQFIASGRVNGWANTINVIWLDAEEGRKADKAGYQAESETIYPPGSNYYTKYIGPIYWIKVENVSKELTHREDI